ncbi:MAG TPA: DoxX family protein [Methylibium sp.]
MGPLLDKFGPLLGRILIAALFIPTGFSKITDFQGTMGYVSSVHLPLPAVAVVVAIVIEFGGGIALLAGYKARWVALALALFTLLSAIFFHNFWASPPDQVMMQTINFWKNVAIAGGLLFVASFGAGPMSIDSSVKPS